MGGRRSRQNSEETARAALDDGNRIVSIGDEWGRMEEEDSSTEQKLKGEDKFLRLTAETPQAPQPVAPSHRNGARASGFWGELGSEDADIETALTNEQDLTRYQQLTRVQDAQVNNAVKQMEKVKPTPSGETLRHNDAGFEAKTIHDTWAEREANDREHERRIHADPDLRMLQTGDTLRRQHVAF
jgi:hypothetical protein